MRIPYSDVKELGFGQFEDIENPVLRNVVWAIRNLKVTEKLILLNLIERYNIEAGGYAFPSVRRIAQDCCVHRRTVQRSVTILQDCEIISVAHYYDDETGRQRSNIYGLTEYFVSTVEKNVFLLDYAREGWYWPYDPYG